MCESSPDDLDPSDSCHALFLFSDQAREQFQGGECTVAGMHVSKSGPKKNSFIQV